MPVMAVLVLHVAAALALALMPDRARRSGNIAAAGVMAATLIWALEHASTVLNGSTIEESVRWIPALDVELTFRLDPLALIFIILISGIGLGVSAFAASYMRQKAHPNRFLSLLVLFAGSMVGLAAADNVFGLFVFWELTTVVSYLLVGFDDHKGTSRASALQAILTTGLGGLVLLAGLVLLTQAGGTASLAELVENPPTGTTVGVGLTMVLIGAFTKSAQAPFHFWLPGAMAAPTPASAYLHSATMVKAGILVMLRLAPGFASDPLWTPLVVSVGLTTMVLGAWRALRQTDLKLLLAYGTVSQLGFMTALIGFGTPALVNAAVAALIGHALFKSSLFLTVGSVEAATGTRDLRLLSGLRLQRPSLALMGGLAAASMAGVAPLLGFVTKEAAFTALIDEEAWLPLAIMAIASAATVAYSLRFWLGAFAVKPDGGVDTESQRVGASLLIPPGSLAAAGLIFGVLPATIDTLVAGVAPGVQLVLWPGWKPALGISVAVVMVGAIMHIRRASVTDLQSRLGASVLGRVSGEGAYRWTIAALNNVADRTTGFFQNGSLPLYLAVILLATLGVPAVAFVVAGGNATVTGLNFAPAEVALGAAVIVPALAVLGAKRRMAAVLLLGAVGYAVAGLFVFYGAPDLALTLLLVETIVVAIFAFVLVRLPRRFEQPTFRLQRLVRATVAVGVGSFITLAALLVGSSRFPAEAPSAAYIEVAPAIGGTNVVNTILTDFRALDTLGEITVVASAAIGVAALVSGLRVRSAA